MKILTVVGARPQFIKASAVSRVLQDKKISEVIVHTGQHYDANMSDIFFKELGIPVPQYNFEIKSSKHGEMTGRMLSSIEDVLLSEKPDWVLVYGDTNSTLAGALAASKLHIPIAHVEAGLRSFNRRMPEEVNRVLTDHMSALLFAPTQVAQDNLKIEGIGGDKVKIVGDVMFDVSKYYSALAKNNTDLLAKLKLAPKQFVLLTCHRQENTNDPKRLEAIFAGLNEVSKTFPVVCPIHPRTKKYLMDSHWFKATPNMHLIDPVGYIDMVTLQENAAVIATDSGGVQKEAYFYEVPCVTLRDETEWVETVEAGWNKLTPPLSAEAVSKAVLTSQGSSGKKIQLYGDGYAANKIVSTLMEY